MLSTTLLGGLNPQTFLRRYWQKTPLLIRNAIPDLISPISAEELAGLACEDGVEARLIEKVRGNPGWSVRHAPFDERDFTSLPAHGWTLLVQDVDKYVPAIAELLDRFRFVPNWRVDDLMVSYATDRGGVGPHVDAYDVFLLQVQGFRRWSISTAAHIELERPGLELKQVRDFQPQQEWLLGPGDMLYLPPGVAHDGIAVGECMTFSIGFRVPADVEMLADLAGLLLETADQQARYSDPGLQDSSADPGLIPASARRHMQRRLNKIFALDPDKFDEWFGCFITEPKPWLRTVSPNRRIAVEQLRGSLGKKHLMRDPAANLCWIPATGAHIRLFSNGNCHVLPSRLTPLVQLLCRQHQYPEIGLRKFRRDTAALKLLVDLYNSGAIHFSRK